MMYDRRPWDRFLAGVALAALALGPAAAADIKLPAKAPTWCSIWTGFYIGGHSQYGRGSSKQRSDPDIATNSKVVSGLTGGVQGGV